MELSTIPAIGSSNGLTATSATSSNPTSALGSQDFFQLLITQLTNQDPLEPTGNEELLRQIASIREIELSSTLTESLRGLSGQQQFGSASSLIGKYVTGTDARGVLSGGVVSAVQFAPGGQPVLQLSNGIQIPMPQLSSIQSTADAAATLVGLRVRGIVYDGGASEVVDGVVTGVGSDARGEPRLELDTGERIDLRAVLEVEAA